MLPQTDLVKEKGFEILYLTDSVDEFAIQMLGQYEEKSFVNICADDFDISSEEEKEALKKENDEARDVLEQMKDAIAGGVAEVRFTNKLKNHPVCLTSEGAISVEMEKTLNAMPMPGDERIKAQLVLEINSKHKVAERLREIAKSEDKDRLGKYAKLLYAQARLIAGMSVENPAELSELICELM